MIRYLAFGALCGFTGYALAVIAASARDLFGPDDFVQKPVEPNVVPLNAYERAALKAWPWNSSDSLDPTYLHPDKAGA